MPNEIEILKKMLFEDNKVRNFKFFAGDNATPETIAMEINKYFKAVDKTCKLD